MAGREVPSIFLDTNVIIGWIAYEAKGTTSAISGILAAIDQRKLKTVLSQLTRLEILDCKHDDTMIRAWKNLQALPNVEVVGVTKKVIDVAYEIRNFYQGLHEAYPVNKKPPNQPDCLLIATAIVAGVDHFVSYDAGRRGPKALSPIELNGLIAGQWNLSIICPEALNMNALAV